MQEVTGHLELARRLLVERRGSRAQPALDDKAVTAWNGLALAAFAEAIPVLERQADLAVAEGIAEAALDLLRGPDGRLARSFRAGRIAGRGGLDDYACLADGLLCLYEATFEERWLVAAGELMDVVEREFADAAGGWFDTASDAEPLIVRPKETQDGATPSGGAAAAAVMLRLAELTGDGSLRDAAERAVGQMEQLAARYPRAFPVWLGALDFSSARVSQVAIVGDPRAADTRLCWRSRGLGSSRTWFWRLAPRLEHAGSPARPFRHRRPSNRLRLPRFRLPPPGDRTRGAGSRAGLNPRAWGGRVNTQPRPVAGLLLRRVVRWMVAPILVRRLRDHGKSGLHGHGVSVRSTLDVPRTDRPVRLITMAPPLAPPQSADGVGTRLTQGP